jgi:thiol-disulfide isomerase/thioredoxin
LFYTGYVSKKLKVVTLVSVVLIAVSTAYVVLRGKPTADTSPTEQTQPTEPTAGNETLSQSHVAGRYAVYTPEGVSSTKGTKILFFYATWCPQCRALEADIKAGKIPDDVTIFKVDYDNNQSLRQKYGVSLQTTLVKVDDTGTLLKKFVAYDEPTLRALIKNLL